MATSLTRGDIKSLLAGNVIYRSQRGIPVSLLSQVSLGAPGVLDADGISVSQNPAAAGNLTITGALAASSVATLDATYGRNVTITSAADDSLFTFTVTGTDYTGTTVVETITGANVTVAAGKKAFKTVTQIAVSGNCGAVTAGTGDVLGLPYRLAALRDVLAKYHDDTVDTGTMVKADANTATATTGDVRGTLAPSSATDGSKVYSVWMKVYGAVNRAEAYGVDQYGG